MPESTPERKAQHLALALESPVQETSLAGFQRYRLEHNALPELDLEAVNLTTTLFDKTMKIPLLISGMTGGAPEAMAINRNLAAAAQATGAAFGVGSQRAAIEHPDLRATFQVRDVAPDVVLLANLGAVQLRKGYGLAQCEEAVRMIGADALAFHLNPLQEALQDRGDVTFAGLCERIASIAHQLGKPVVVKEVGWGLSGHVARRLVGAGVAALDVQGAGGTSWAIIEGMRAHEHRLRETSEAFAHWGIPTPEVIAQVRAACPHTVVIGSGGVRTGVDGAKAIALGADIVAAAHPFLQAATHSTAAVIERINQFVYELRVAMFCTGCGDLTSLRSVAITYV